VANCQGILTTAARWAYAVVIDPSGRDVTKAPTAAGTIVQRAVSEGRKAETEMLGTGSSSARPALRFCLPPRNVALPARWAGTLGGVKICWNSGRSDHAVI
jgi:hypothetical protein